MNVTIIGSGNIARGIATRLMSGGHNVTIMDRQLDKARSLAELVGVNSKKDVKIRGITLGGPIKDEIVILAIPYGATSEVIENLGKQLAGKTIINHQPAQCHVRRSVGPKWDISCGRDRQ